MKKIKVLIPIIAMLSLTSCNNSFNVDDKKEEDKKDNTVVEPDKKDDSKTDDNKNDDNQKQDPIHIHTYSVDWEKDDNYHWHEATCEHTNLVQDKGAHTFGEWIVDTQATTSTTGSQHKACSVCGKTVTEVIPVKENTKGLTQDTAFTVEEFLVEAKKLANNAVSQKQYYVTGTVTECTYNTSYGSFYFYFEGYNGSGNDKAYVYSANIDSNIIKDEYKSDPSSLNGATVTVYGYIKNYVSNGSSTYEIAFLSAKDSPTGSATSPRVIAIEKKAGPSHVHTYSTEWSKNETYHWHVATCEHTTLVNDKNVHNYGDWTIDNEPTATEQGTKHRTCTTCGYVDSINYGLEKTFTMYSFNDFHGAVNEYSSQRHIGLAKFGTFLKTQSVNDNTLIVDCGDTFQGSIESNYNSGALITEVFNYAHVDVHTLGNHDFDWGEDKIEANKARSNAADGWKMTNLAANIYDYTFSSHTEGNTQQSRLGDKYYIKTMENGLKVGVIGVIGRDQITSICSPLVEDICFKEHIRAVQDLSDELRTTKGVDVVIASIHEGGSDAIGLGLASVSPVTGKKYCDYVACGHSHQNESLEENGVPYTQGAAYGECIYKSTFTFENNAVSNIDVECLNYSTVTSAVTTIDPNITSIMDRYAAEYASVANEVIAPSAAGKFGQYEEMPNVLAKAMYTAAKAQGYNVDIAYTNQARYAVQGTSWKYSQLYEAFPFDNVVYIVKIKGSKNCKQIAEHNYNYHEASLTSFDTNTWYTVAVIDYLLWHTNSSRNYDYFSHSTSNMQILGTIKNSKNENHLYRDICADYVRGLTDGIIASDYSSNNACFTAPTVA